MNLALWLERAGKSNPDRPAVGLGTRVLRGYGELAGRVARLAGALTDTYGLRPGDRVAIAAKNSPDYLDLLYAIWHAGLAAVPANAKLHGAELGYILEHSGARAASRRPASTARSPGTRRQSLERLITVGSREYEQLFTADPIAPVARDGNDLAWLFYTSGTTGRPKGAMLTHRVLAVASHAYLAGCRSGRARRRHPARGADEPRLRALHHGARGAAWRQRGAGIGRVRARGGVRPDRRVAARLDVRGAHHDQAAGRVPGRLPGRQYPHAGLGRRADVRRGRAQGARPVRSAAGANLRPGRKPDDHHDLVARGHRRPRPSALARAPRLRRPALRVRRRDRGGCRRPRAAGGRGRRNPLPRRHGDAGLLANPQASEQRSRAAGCIPATSACSTRTAISRSRTAPRT